MFTHKQLEAIVANWNAGYAEGQLLYRATYIAAESLIRFDILQKIGSPSLGHCQVTIKGGKCIVGVYTPPMDNVSPHLFLRWVTLYQDLIKVAQDAAASLERHLT